MNAMDIIDQQFLDWLTTYERLLRWDGVVFLSLHTPKELFDYCMSRKSDLSSLSVETLASLYSYMTNYKEDNKRTMWKYYSSIKLDEKPIYWRDQLFIQNIELFDVSKLLAMRDNNGSYLFSLPRYMAMV